MASAIPAGIAAAGSLFSGITGKNAAKKASKLQAQAFDKAIGEQRRQYDTSRADFAPFLSAGGKALASVSDLLGLNGDDAMSSAIAALKASPAFTSLYDTGQDTILQNAAATGGLRGGDLNGSLAQFGSGLLASVIQNQLQNLGGIVNVGSGTAGQLGALGQNNANMISNLLGQQGAARASGVLGGATATNSMFNDFTKILQNFGAAHGW